MDGSRKKTIRLVALGGLVVLVVIIIFDVMAKKGASSTSSTTGAAGSAGGTGAAGLGSFTDNSTNTYTDNSTNSYAASNQYTPPAGTVNGVPVGISGGPVPAQLNTPQPVVQPGGVGHQPSGQGGIVHQPIHPAPVPAQHAPGLLPSGWNIYSGGVANLEPARPAYSGHPYAQLYNGGLAQIG